jgi:hypothetical protein
MDIIILEFESKVEEIDEYFSFIRTTTFLEREVDETKIVIVSMTVFNVLKANLFLLLYNLIESSFKNALEKICIEITDSQLTYIEVVPAIKKLWLEKNYKNFENIRFPREMKKSEHIMNIIESITEDIIEIRFYSNQENRKNDDISGNIDAREIDKINKKYGIELINNTNIKREYLLTIKNQRNNLAHGDESFNECGESYTIYELEEIKSESVDYMRFILNNIKEFINEKKYSIIERG